MRHLLSIACAILALSGGAALAGVPTQPIAVPEPSSLALIAAGVGAVAWLKFRRRK